VRALASAAAVALSAWRTGASARADDQAPALRGGWAARAGASVFKGRWTANAPQPASDDAQGTWTLLGPNDDVTLDGPWSARRNGKTWQGTWMARTRPGALFSGTWQTAVKGIPGKTFFDLLAHAKAGRIAGTWRMGRLRGDWWLETTGPAPPP
jgi:hypothetical protein